MVSRTLAPKFAPKHREYIRAATRATVAVAEGAVRAGKTIDNIAAFAWLIEQGTPDRMHLATGSTAANAKLNIGDANGFGLEWIFRGRCRWTKYRGNEALAIQSHGREYVVIFSGGAKSDSFKKIRGNSYGMWIATEINLHHENTIKEAFNRQLAARVRRVFWDLNPTSPADWIYTRYIDRFPQQFGARYVYRHFTIKDNATITAQRLTEIEAQYDKDSVWYKRDILGQRCIAQGLVYPGFDPARHVGEYPKEDGCFLRFVISLDYGIQNPTAMLLWGLHESGVWWCMEEYYHSGRETNDQKTDADYITMLERLAGGLPVDRVIVDPSATSFIVAARRAGFTVKKAQNDVLPGIRHVEQCLKDGALMFDSGCKRTLGEFGLYSWDAESNTDKVIKDNDHAMDAVRYFVETERIYKANKPAAGLGAWL